MAVRVVTVLLALLSFSFCALANDNLGQVLFNSDQFKLYYRSQGKSIIFSGDLPTTWSYIVNVDANKDGVWGSGPHESARKSYDSGVDFDYAQTTSGQLCPQYIYDAAPQNSDFPYSSSDCGKRPSKGYMRTKLLPGNRAMKIYFIPKSELVAAGGGTIHIVITMWDGHEWRNLQTLQEPILLRV
jgi:hypothetical protein